MNKLSWLKLLLIFSAFIIFVLPMQAKAIPACTSPVVDSAGKKLIRKLTFPVPPASVERLFYIQRMPNTNTLIYELNVDEKTGKPNVDEPVHPYWIRYNEKGQKEELSYIQRKFAYGLVQKPMGDDKYDIRFVSYKKFPLTLMKGADGKYHIFATVARKPMALRYIFIQIEGGSFWLPNVVYVEMKGTDPATGKEFTERFKP
ncbi:CDP-alcohol phosphatidyltransferase [Mucilaginibacter sp. PAMC 26640]|nr:CDP-alcohol phosphatidyltransferase [Mucilaginibacter sp. PAMC 26640]